MKAFFGMTAAVLMVVMLSHRTVHGRIEEGGKCNPIGREEYVLEKNIECDGNNVVRYAQKFKCTGKGVWEDRGRILYASNPCPAEETCKMIGNKPKCVCPSAGEMLRVMSGAQQVCGCTVCNECERCAGNKCVPIQNPSPSNPNCLTK